MNKQATLLSKEDFPERGINWHIQYTPKGVPVVALDDLRFTLLSYANIFFKAGTSQPYQALSSLENVIGNLEQAAKADWPNQKRQVENQWKPKLIIENEGLVGIIQKFVSAVDLLEPCPICGCSFFHLDSCMLTMARKVLARKLLSKKIQEAKAKGKAK